MPVLPIVIKASPLPVDFDGTPQQFLDAIAARLSLQSDQTIALIVTGAVAPTSNVGPWLANGVSWYVWDTSSGTYIPQILAAGSLAGLNAYPAAARLASTQTLLINNTPQTIGFDAEYIDPSNLYNPSTYRYTAGATGNYLVTANVKVHNGTGVAASMELALNIFKNGVVLPYGTSGASQVSPSGDNWFMNLSALVPVASTDYLDIRLTAGDGTNTGNVTVPQADFSIHRIPSI